MHGLLRAILPARSPRWGWSPTVLTMWSPIRLLPKQPGAARARRRACTRASDGCGGSGKLGAVCVRTGRCQRPRHFVHRAEALDDLLSAMRGRLGALKVQPVTPRAGEAAHRVLVQGRRDARTPLVLLPPIILQNATGGPSAEAEAVLRHGAALAFA